MQTAIATVCLNLIADLGLRPPDDLQQCVAGGIDRAAADFRELGERAARRGFRIAFEALAWGRHIHDYRDTWEVVRRADHPAVGLVLDTRHRSQRDARHSEGPHLPRPGSTSGSPC